MISHLCSQTETNTASKFVTISDGLLHCHRFLFALFMSGAAMVNSVRITGPLN